MQLKIACATDNGVDLIDRHFGDAEFFSVYKITKNDYQPVKKIANTTEKEERHADPQKAKGISQILKEEGIQVCLARKFGPNMERIKKKFVPVICGEDTIEDAVKKLAENYDSVLKKWAAGTDREHLVL